MWTTILAGAIAGAMPAAPIASEAAAPAPAAGEDEVRPGDLLISAEPAELRRARPFLEAKGFEVRDMDATPGEAAIAVRPPAGRDQALMELMKDLTCGRLPGLDMDNVSFIGRGPDPAAPMRPVHYLLYGSAGSVGRIAGEARRRGWRVAEPAPDASGRLFTNLKSPPGLTQGDFMAFTRTLSDWKIGDASLSPVKEGALFFDEYE